MNGTLPSPQPLLSVVQHSGLEPGKSVNQKALINKLNFINFQDGTVQFNFRHTRFETTLTLAARPLPCTNEYLTCTWLDPDLVARAQSSYTFHNLIIADGKRLLIVEPELLYMDGQRLELLLPKTCHESSARQVKRHLCSGIDVRITQNGVMFSGRLHDFTPNAMRVELEASDTAPLFWTSLESTLYLSMFDQETLLYSGECTVIRHERTARGGIFVLQPTCQQIQRFKPKEHRSIRLQPLPTPSIVFVHPVTGASVSLKSVNISGTGIAVTEDSCTAVLLPGLILPDVEISFGGSSSISCKAQVIYRHPAPEPESSAVICGLAYLDMDVKEHVRLISYLHQTENGSSYVCPSINMDALWKFFFDAGFIYPEKYAYFEANKESVKQTYRILYEDNPHISRHLIYQENGAILAHMSMVRFFEDAWLVQHHAANKSESMRAGLSVLNQVGQFTNDCANLMSAHMKYTLSYFRPANRFPNRVFGGMARFVNDQKACSLDAFAYFHIKQTPLTAPALPAPWRLELTCPEDLSELENYYKHVSGGLMLDACDLKPETAFQDSVSGLYRGIGLKKARQLLSLKRGENLAAVVVINISDIGLNMSNLTNCPTFLVIDDYLPQNVLTALFAAVASFYRDSSIPALMFPADLAAKCALDIATQYTMWVYNTRIPDPYFRYFEQLLKSTSL